MTKAEQNKAKKSIVIAAIAYILGIVASLGIEFFEETQDTGVKPDIKEFAVSNVKDAAFQLLPVFVMIIVLLIRGLKPSTIK